jgi:hypothetical protein
VIGSSVERGHGFWTGASHGCHPQDDPRNRREFWPGACVQLSCICTVLPLIVFYRRYDLNIYCQVHLLGPALPV